MRTLSTCTLVAALTLGTGALVGCEETVSKTEETTVRSDGSSQKETETVTREADGTIKKETTSEKTPPDNATTP